MLDFNVCVLYKKIWIMLKIILTVSDLNLIEKQPKWIWNFSGVFKWYTVLKTNSNEITVWSVWYSINFGDLVNIVFVATWRLCHRSLSPWPVPQTDPLWVRLFLSLAVQFYLSSHGVPVKEKIRNLCFN